MCKWTIRLVFLYIVFFPFVGFANIDPANLIKVTPETDPTCVEYYHYKNAMYCSTTAQNNERVDPNIRMNEHQTILFDERPWFAAWGQHTAAIDTVEYIPAGDHIEKWTELVTSQFVPDPENKISPKQFADTIIQGIKEAGFSPIIHTIQDTPDQFIFEFRLESPPNQAQDELQKITRGHNGLYILHYTIKKADMGQKNREKWVSILEKSSIK